MSLGTVGTDPEVGRAPSPLQRCTGDGPAFLRDTWNRRATVHRSADPRGFGDLLTLDDVDHLITTTSLRIPTFRLVKDGKQVEESAYTRSGRTGSRPVSGMADAARMFELFRQGATIVLQGLHRYWEPLTRFCRGLELELGHPCQVNAYITPSGARGLALHSDPHDVFVLQAFGRKVWEVHAAPAEGAREPIAADVRAGDSIYMPAGTPHAASTQETISGHLTIGVHVTPWREVVADVWRELEREPEMDDPVPAGWNRDLGTFAQALRARLDRLGSALAAVDPAEVTALREERFLSRRSSILRGLLPDQVELEALDDATVLRRRRGSLCAVRSKGDRIVALLGDRRLEMPRWLEPAMRRVAAADEISVGTLRDVVFDPQSRIVLARRLVREGLFTFDRV